ncbi:hypothetical protein V494_05267 [Pseudogymnoascus sp. VKM F-4513 (FW-928)]|nr:hypothetical protein V494_05267 [Pseudogymnoascus sp. VKM F-4513 (FW-928)]
MSCRTLKFRQLLQGLLAFHLQPGVIAMASLDEEASRQMPKRLPQLRPNIPQECPSHDSTLAGWGKFQREYQQSQMQTQEVAESTHVDVLMRAIQAMPASDSGRGGGGASANAGEDPTKPYKCYTGECRKAFFQKAHLEVHIRTHTGAKPYVRPPTSPSCHLPIRKHHQVSKSKTATNPVLQACTYPLCTHAFSQLNNLKVHLRVHTGERPFACPTCGKTFAQRSNVRVHAAVHDTAKKYVCHLDGCGKHFKLLGNLKRHMNDFHVEALGALTARFAESDARGGGKEGMEDELLEYFRGLYRKANKGTRGRRKGRKAASTTHNTDSTATSPPSLSSSTSQLSSLASLPLAAPPLTSISSTGGVPAHFDMRMGGMWMDASMEMDIFEGSSSGIGSLWASNLGSLYEWTYNDEEGEGLVFGDRMY